MKIIELTTVEDMLAQIGMIHHLYPKISVEKYKEYLQEMITRNYTQGIRF